MCGLKTSFLAKHCHIGIPVFEHHIKIYENVILEYIVQKLTTSNQVPHILLTAELSSRSMVCLEFDSLNEPKSEHANSLCKYLYFFRILGRRIFDGYET